MTKRRALTTALTLALAANSLSVFHAPLRAQQTDRAKHIGGKFMCMCGCSQVLTQCNHVGCTTSTVMLKKLDRAVARGDSEAAITQALVQEFGTQVYAEPPKSGLSLMAWMLPSVYLLLGTAVVVAVIWRWRSHALEQVATAVTHSVAGISAEDLKRARQRVARETED
jgi:cytochrome c-type biogenesis protein CcmH/NrfF